MRTVSVGDARDGFSRLLADVEATHERVTITRHGRAVAVVVSPEDLESLEETLELLAVPGAVQAIAEGNEDLAAGRVVAGPEVLARFRRD